MAAFQYKRAEQVVTVINGIPKNLTIDTDTGETRSSDVITTLIKADTEVSPFDDSVEMRKVREAVGFVKDVLNPFNDQLDFKLLDRPSEDFEFIKTVVINRGVRP